RDADARVPSPRRCWAPCAAAVDGVRDSQGEAGLLDTSGLRLFILKRVPRAVSTGRGDGAFMKPRGCNRWQSVANHAAAKAAETSENCCHGVPPVACDVPW